MLGAQKVRPCDHSQPLLVMRTRTAIDDALADIIRTPTGGHMWHRTERAQSRRRCGRG
jgi:hypothetical protein